MVGDAAARDDELVPPPPRGRVFEHAAVVGLADTSPAGRARLDAISRALQDAAYFDAADAGLAERGAWIVRRLRIRVQRFPAFGEGLRLHTWCSGASPLAAERRTTIRGDAADVEAVATWVFLDAATGRPRRLGPEFDAVYGAGAQGRRARTRLRHERPPQDAERRPWRFRAADLDLAGHVNNAAYWQVAEELIAERGEPGALDVEVEFREPAQAGDAFVLAHGARAWVVAAGGAGAAPVAIHASFTGLRPG